MKKLMIAAAIAGAVGMAQADFSPLEEFESPTWALGDKVSLTPVGGYRYWNASANDTNEQYKVIETVVTNYSGTGDTALDNAGANYLALTGVELLERYVLPQDQETEAAYDLATSDLYIDTLVKFTVTEDDAPAPGEGDKLCIWVGVVSNETTGVITTNLMVTAGYVYDDEGNINVRTYATTTTFGDGSGDKDINAWHRLTVKSIAGIDRESVLDGFIVYIDGEPVSADSTTIVAAFLDEEVSPLNSSWTAAFAANQLFPSLVEHANGGTITSVGFKGSGAIDNLQFSETDPNPQQTGWKDPTDATAMADIAGQTAGVAYPSLASTALAGADAAKLTIWATDQSKGALAFSDAADGVDTATVEAFLLNCAVADVDTEKAAFTVNITWNETTEQWDVTGPSGKTYNGTLTIKGSADLTTPKPWGEYNAATHKFMYGVLEF